jgi:broad specificity phosphatase PhoE
MSRLILVRHAAPTVDPSRPSAEWALSDEGRAGARALSARLQRYEPAIVLSGPEAKMTGTAEILAGSIGVPAIVIPGLAEHARRSAQYGTRAEFEESIRRLFREPTELVYGDESADATFARFAQALDGALRKHAARSVLAVSGGTAISVFVGRRCGRDPFALWKSLGLPTAIVLDRANWRVEEVFNP